MILKAVVLIICNHCNFIIQPCILTKNYAIFKMYSNSTHYNYTCILALTMLQMATRVAETCRWSLRNKITFINPSAYFGSVTTFYASDSTFLSNSTWFPKQHCFLERPQASLVCPSTKVQWKPLIVITLGPALFDNNNRLITLSGGCKHLRYLTQFIVTTFYMYKKQQNLFKNLCSVACCLFAFSSSWTNCSYS